MIRQRTVLSLLLVLALAGCSIQETLIVELEDLVVAEVHVEIGGALLGGNRVMAFLHRTLGTSVPGARVVITRGGTSSVELQEADQDACYQDRNKRTRGTCYVTSQEAADEFQPGEQLELTIELTQGRTLRSATTIPGEFTLIGIEDGSRCLLPADTPLTVQWSRSNDTWAYISETLIVGLESSLSGTVASTNEADSLWLLGLSLSASDTTIVFPTEFGIFQRFDLDAEIAAQLQKGLTPGTQASVTVTAANRNYANWARGGNFNPSGRVSIPSVTGDGTGVFGASVTRTFEMVVNPDSSGAAYELPSCPTS